ncbi:MAG: PEP-CTERM sorting domain-containing protein [Myxococcales bacterium]|nr:PEP-CTERM sorting domain-containing protein [Myxococcales bacterium]
MTRWILGFCCLLAASPVLATSLTPVNDFEDGTLFNWAYAAPSQLTNVATGGPAGAGDHWLRLETDGASQPGGRPVITNASQWSGDYVAANVQAVAADLANFGAEDLHIRFAIQGAGGERFVTTDAIVLSADANWHHLTFALDEADFTQVTGGSATFGDVLLDVERIRFLVRELSPGWNGDEIATVIGFDNIANLPEPGTLLLVGVGLAWLGRTRRRIT